MSGAMSDFQLGGAEKPVQRGVISLTGGTGTATISTVDTNKARVRHCGSESGSSVSGNGKLVLTNSTTITASWGSATGTISWELEEAY